MNKPILSICIPTYNRASYLDQCLLAIYSQLERNPVLFEKVEVAVSNNDSPDNTEEVAMKYKNKYSNFTYCRNSENIGADKNYINSVSIANGVYGWIIGDDDIIANGALEFVVNFLEKNKLALLTVNHRTFLNIGDAMQKKGSYENGDIIFAASHNDFFKSNYCVGILCTMIFDRDIWLKTDRVGYGTGWSYYEIALKILAQSGLPAAYLKSPAVIVREDCNWVKNGAELFTFIGWKQTLRRMPSYGYDLDIVNSILVGFPNKLFVILLRAKGHDLKCSWGNYRLIFSEFKKYPVRLFFASILYIVPNILIKLVRDLNKKTFKIKI